MMIKRLWIVMLLTLLTGCQPKPAESKNLVLVLTGLQQANEKTFFRTFVRLFEAEHGIKVDVIYESPDQLSNKIEQGALSPDVIMVDTARMATYIEQDQMAPIDWIDLEADRTFTSLMDAYTHGDQRFFVPVSIDVYLSMYNKAALPYMPESVVVERDSQQAITRILDISWQDFSSWAKTIKSETGVAKFGLPYGAVNSQLLYPITGIGLAMGEHHLPRFDDSGALKAWSYLTDLKSANALAYGGNFAALTQPTELLANQELWMSFGHMGPLGTAYNMNPNRYVLGPIPKDDLTGNRGTTAGAWAFGILTETTHMKGAKAWIKFITDPEINYLYCAGLGGVMSPIQEVNNHLGTGSSDQIMKIGLSMLNDQVRVQIVDTHAYTDWQAVKMLYHNLYIELLEGQTMDINRLEVYQTQLNQLKKDVPDD